jgi:hypothetical protein
LERALQILEVCAWSLNGPAAFWSQLDRGDAVTLTPAQAEAIVARVLESRSPQLVESVVLEMREQNRAGILGNDGAFVGGAKAMQDPGGLHQEGTRLSGSASRVASPASAHSRLGSRQGLRRGLESARSSGVGLQRGAQREEPAADVASDVAQPVALDRLLCFLVVKSSQLQEKDEECVHTVLKRHREGDTEGVTREGFAAAMKQLELPVRVCA